MPTYDFECEPCNYQAEIVQGVNEPSVQVCPKCSKETFQKIFISFPNVFVKGEVKTIAQQAEKNTKNMGSYELEEKRFKDDLTKGVTDEHKATRDQHKAIVSMTPQQQTHWIKTGEKPE
tara:strand:+ start:4577 stop:4933 length:357 start_codon:yes stop_codon:yes gene_type:complete